MQQVIPLGKCSLDRQRFSSFGSPLGVPSPFLSHGLQTSLHLQVNDGHSQVCMLVPSAQHYGSNGSSEERVHVAKATREPLCSQGCEGAEEGRGISSVQPCSL